MIQAFKPEISGDLVRVQEPGKAQAVVGPPEKILLFMLRLAKMFIANAFEFFQKIMGCVNTINHLKFNFLQLAIHQKNRGPGMPAAVLVEVFVGAGKKSKLVVETVESAVFGFINSLALRQPFDKPTHQSR